MVLTRPFHCPTQVYGNLGYAKAVAELVDGRRWALATSAGWIRRGAVDALIRSAGEPAAVLGGIPENPKVSDVLALAAELCEVDVVVALGGGSVMDCAKALVGYHAIDRNDDILMSHLRDGAGLPDGFAPIPVIAVPTTSGTGSEITQWATVWGDEKVKFSFSHPKLFPAQVVLDPTLCVSMTPAVTLASGLDALSHAMESVWNRNATPLSDQFAISAISRLKSHLPRALKEPEDVATRREIQVAALLAGFAMSTTQTALAHSISYPFTALFGMPHGFACSFTLPEVARYNAEGSPSRLTLIAEAFGASLADLPDDLAAWLGALGIGPYLEAYVSPEAVDELGDNVITRARAANNLRAIDGAQARALARRSLERFSTSTQPVARIQS